MRKRPGKQQPRLCCAADGVFAAQLMSVEGLTRENVASHLQKYRLQLKKDHRLDEDGNLAEAQVCCPSPCAAWHSYV